MSTLIAVYNSDGCVGRCDAKCYDAQYPDCDCICGGKNHGTGRKQAEANTIEMGNRWIEQYKQRKGLLDDAKGQISSELFQLKLF